MAHNDHAYLHMHGSYWDSEEKGTDLFNKHLKKEVENSILSNGINFSFVKTANYFSYPKGHVAG